MLDRWGVSRRHVQLVLVLFVVALVAKGGVLVRGEAIDDYVYASGLGSGGLNAYFGQGRFLQGLIVGAIDSFGVNLNDLYLVFGLLALILQAIVVVAMLRFFGLADVRRVGLAAAIMVAHPYSTEILTFRVALPAYCVMLAVLVLVLEIVARKPTAWSTRFLAFALTLAALFTYQTILNYLLVAVIFAWLAGQIARNTSTDSSISGVDPGGYLVRARTLLFITVSAPVAFALVLGMAEHFQWLVVTDQRARLIAPGSIVARFGEVVATLQTMFWTGEPVMPRWVKALAAALIAMSVLAIVAAPVRGARFGSRLWNRAMILFAMVLLVPLSIGMIIPFQAWWPVPRVLAHTAFIVGLLFALADKVVFGIWSERWYGLAQTAGRGVLLIAFLFIDNQIFADQQKINEWDRALATRLLTRMETLPRFTEAKFLHVHGGSWGYPAGLRTAQGDMNISATSPAWSKIAMIVFASGYRFEQALGDRKITGERYCESVSPWPASESVTIDGDLAIICLKKSQ